MTPQNYNLLSPQERRALRLLYIQEQGGMCCHCGQQLNGPPDDAVARKWINKRLFPESFFKWPVHLHHCHKTGMTIGAVHNYCNAVLWQYYGE